MSFKNELKVRQACVTGGGGFIGRALTKALLEKGIRVSVLDDFSTGNLRKTNDLQGEGDLDIVEGSVLVEGDIVKAISGCDTVYHLAAIPSVPLCEISQAQSFIVNVEGTRKIIEACEVMAPRRVVFVSTCALYKDRANDEEPAMESEWIDPAQQFHYPMHKYIAEVLALSAHLRGNVSCSIVRPFNVVGRGQRDGGAYSAVVPAFLRMVEGGIPPTINGDGGQSRDFVPLPLVAEGILRAGTVEEAGGTIINMATAVETTINGLFEMILRISGMNLTPSYDDGRPGEMRAMYGSTYRMREILGLDEELETYTLQKELEGILEDIQQGW